MIAGKVRDGEAVVRFKILDSSGAPHEIAAVVDTGFSAMLSLPATIIEMLKLPWQGHDRAILGDGSECLFKVYEANLDWDGDRKVVPIHLSETEPLIGMELLHGFELNIKVKQGGKVTIKRMSSR